MQRLENRTALVTGAASGIGRATALRFSQEGARVGLIDVNAGGLQETAHSIQDTGGESLLLTADLTNPEATAQVVQAAVDEWGQIDVLFSGVGVSGRRWGDGPLHECTLEAWQRVLAINLSSMFYICKPVLQQMLLQQSGSIILLSSVLGMVGGDEDFSTHAYAASKGGIISLARGMASYYANHAIRVNVVAPGLIATPMSKRAQSDEHILERLQTLQPLTGTMGEAEDIAAAVAYLASDDARFVTGTVVPVDGGWTMR